MCDCLVQTVSLYMCITTAHNYLIQLNANNNDIAITELWN